jgi:TRAP-type mannitol/chloroaromatic compound transport system permease small subunit
MDEMPGPAPEHNNRNTFIHSTIRCVERITRGGGWVSAWLIFPLIFSLCYEVFARYLVGRPTIWSYELTYMLMTGIFMLGAAHALADGAHIRIDFLYAKYSPRTRAIIDLAGYLIVYIPVIWIVAYSALRQAIGSYNSGEVSEFSPWRPLVWPFRVTLALGFALLAIQGAAEALKSALTLLARERGDDIG